MPVGTRLYPYGAKLRTMIGRQRPQLAALACEIVEVCPAEIDQALPSVILPQEAAKITDVPPETDRETEQARLTGRPVRHLPTKRYVFEDVYVWPGGFSTPRGMGVNLRPPPFLTLARGRVPRREKGYFGASWASLRYFGHWVKDGLPSLLLAAEDEEIVFPSEPGWHHAAPLLKMTGLSRSERPYAHYERLTFGFDIGHNSSKRARVAEIRRRIMSALPPSPHERVYLKRGHGGAARTLANEEALIAALQARGFAVLSSDMPAEALMRALNGVRTLVSIEGSHSAAAFLGIAADGVMLSISPADRFNAHHNDWGNTIGFTFAAAVAERTADGHAVDVGAVLETVALAEEEAARRKAGSVAQSSGPVSSGGDQCERSP